MRIPARTPTTAPMMEFVVSSETSLAADKKKKSYSPLLFSLTCFQAVNASVFYTNKHESIDIKNMSCINAVNPQILPDEAIQTHAQMF